MLFAVLWIFTAPASQLAIVGLAPGTDVMILKNIFAKKVSKNIGVFC
jgi:hypothetical protein